MPSSLFHKYVALKEKAYMGRSTSCDLFRIGLCSRFIGKSGNGMDESDEYSTTNSGKELKRKTVRHSITGTVEFQWQAVDGRWHDGIGITRDIGKGGVFIESDSIPPVGSPLKLTVTLPSESSRNIILQLGGTGSVRHVRREPYPTNGFGVSANFHVEVPMSTVKRGGKR